VLEVKDYEAAERIYREDLLTFPNNGWSLFGLMQSLMKQEKNEEADRVRKQFDASWKWADIELVSSRIL